MQNASATAHQTAQLAPPVRDKSALELLARKWLGPLVAIWVFSGGIIFIDPSPYELFFFLLLPVAVLAGVGIHRANQRLFSLMVLFTPFALIGAFQVNFQPVYQAMAYVIVTVYLWFTAWFVANYVADAPHLRLRGMMNAFTAVALFATIIGILAYLRIIPDFGQLIENSRVRSTFKDPNVFAPFIIVPAVFALQKAFMDRGRRAVISAIIYGILFIGIFVSFSRAAWGYMLLSSALVFVLCFILEANGKDKARMIVLAMLGAAALILALVALLSIDDVRALFMERASLVQNYDSGSTGRFGRQSYAFELALANPWGIGPLEFRNLRIVEEPHNTYVNVLHAYGWGGGLAYYALVFMTLRRALGTLLRSSPNRLLLIPLVAVYVPLVLESAIIDTDHWRHYFLVTGMIWGVTTGYKRVTQEQRTRRGALI